MPHYDYVCSKCGHQKEIFQKITDSPLMICPKCQESTFNRKIGGGGGILFRCSGFYETDYKSSKNGDNKSDNSLTSSSSYNVKNISN